MFSDIQSNSASEQENNSNNISSDLSYQKKGFKSDSNSISSPFSHNNSTMLDSFRGKRWEDIDYPKFKRSNSTKVFHVNSEFIEGIKEEEKEEEEFSFAKRRSDSFKKFSPKTFMPKELLIFDNKIQKPETIPNTNLGLQMMDIIPEIDDEKVLKNEQLLLKSPRIKFPSDIEEEKIVPNVPKKLVNVSKTVVDEEDIITEEKESENVYEAEEFKRKRTKSKSTKQFQNFIDKEEPPEIANILDVPLPEIEAEETIKEDREGEEGDDMIDKDFQSLRKRPKKEVIVDEIDDESFTQPGRVKTIFSRLEAEEIINELDEYNNINNNNGS
ncbi:MAG: hypothetical protein MJ252_28360 [archaeon]|nr:hypothetical protein [archaeon]